MRDGNLYARGAADDKGQMYMHIKAVEALRAVYGTLPVNLKFLIEGEEEIGGASITRYVSENQAKLRAEAALVSDTASTPLDAHPVRRTARSDLPRGVGHRSGARPAFGPLRGAAPNPIFGLIELLSKVKDAQGVIRVPGIYDDVRPPARPRRQAGKTCRSMRRSS